MKGSERWVELDLGWSRRDVVWVWKVTAEGIF